jgi:hypothetical protein
MSHWIAGCPPRATYLVAWVTALAARGFVCVSRALRCGRLEIGLIESTSSEQCIGFETLFLAADHS